ncbi:MAG TPA: topoisomerase DNA-binding C4 zinc finger domain-containing protein, partial [Longimicrobiales bacterium]
TSEMETELDKIEEGDMAWRHVLEQFYEPFSRQLREGEKKSDSIVKDVAASEVSETCPECGKPMVVKWNRYGRFLACTGYPECKHTQPIDKKESAEPRPIGEKCPLDGGELVERAGRFGPFIACTNYPKCKFTRPVTIPGLKCPECGQGDVGEKRTRRGKPFWGCTRYPDCQWSSWDRPVAGPCPDCGSPYLVQKSTKARGDFVKCPRCRGEFAPEAFGLEVSAPAGAAAGGADTEE